MAERSDPASGSRRGRRPVISDFEGELIGLTLGGGIGWLMRRHGLTVDNLTAAEVVTAEGDRVITSEMLHPELFWGLRGGGGGLGAVTPFTYRLHPVGPEVLGGLVLWPLEDGPAVLAAYRQFTANAPPEIATRATDSVRPARGQRRALALSS